MIKKEKLLILAPHTDDESLGCGGLIARTIEEGGEVSVLVFTTNYGVSTYDEFNKAMHVLNVSFLSKQYFTALTFDQTAIIEMISVIETTCRTFKPTTVAIPFQNSFHQDHEVIAKAAMSALRPHGYIPQKVLAYEQPYYGIWDFGDAFKPNYYVDITNYLDKKLEALKCYKSQKIPFDMIKAMAQLRGGESGTKYAEAYILMREVI